MALFESLVDLKQAVREEAERLNHAKFELAFPRIIASAEHRMFHGADEPLKTDPLRLRVMETTVTIAFVAGDGVLPDGYLSTLRLQWNGYPKTSPRYEVPHTFFTNRYTTTSGSPTVYTIEGGGIYLSPLITGDISFVYYKRPLELSDDTDSNVVLTTYPMLYFHAALIEAYSYIRNPNEMQKHYAAYRSLSGGLLRSQSNARRASSSPLAPRLPNWRDPRMKP